jgi:segregation and condensation protein B
MLNENEQDIKLESLLEAIILAVGKPISFDDLLKIFSEEERPSKKELKEALVNLQASCEQRGVSLVELASGYQFQVKLEWASFITRLWEEKAPRYSRALLETLALVAYRQPITRGEIEEIRGVSISQSIFKTLQEEREWIRVVGHKDLPGRPALYATTKEFLDYFGLKSLEELPSLPEIMNLDSVELPDMSFDSPQSSSISELEKAEHLETETEIADEIADEVDIEAETEFEAEIDVETETEIFEEEITLIEEEI